MAMQSLALASKEDSYTRAANDDCINGGARSRTKYTYDNDGNAITRNGSGIAWSSYNLPISMAAPGETSTFNYGDRHQKWYQQYSGPAGVEYTTYLDNLVEKVVTGSGVDWRHYVYAGSGLAAIASRRSDGANTLRYVLGDSQAGVSGFVAGTANPSSTLVNESFEPYGTRRNPATWSGAPLVGDVTTINGISRVGYTGQTMLGDMKLIHMNGRVMDSVTGRFLSADPYVTAPGFTQNFNRYSYVYNSPLTLVDPSGYSCSFWTDLFQNLIAAMRPYLSKVSADGAVDEILITANCPKSQPTTLDSNVSIDFNYLAGLSPSISSRGNVGIRVAPPQPQGHARVCKPVPTSPAERAALARGDVDSYYNSRLSRGDQYASLALDVVHARGFMGNAARLLMGFMSTVSHDVNDVNSFDLVMADMMSGQVSLDLARAHMAATDADLVGVPHLLSANDIRNYHEDYFSARGLPRFTFGGDWHWPFFQSADYWYGGCETSP